MAQSNEPTFFFYDYETFGTSPALDRPCQFAGVRTDKDLNVIGKPLVIYCQPPNDYLPQPEACLITGITPQTAMRQGLTEPEFIAKIHEELSVPNTCGVGYNNIRFDDEVSRYTLYRNFFDPYGWSWQNGNSRWDLLDVMRAAYALRPEGIEWPENDEGLTSFKLEHLSVANGIEHSNAHDAMADVYATIEMAKKLKAAQPRLFDYLYTHRNKNKLTPLIDVVSMKPLVHISGMFGVERGNTSWIVPVAWHPDNKNAVITVDLARDPSPLFELDASALRERLYTKRDNLGLDELPVPVKLVHINKCPILAEAKTLRPEDAERLNIDRAACLDNLKKLQAHPEIREKLVELFAEKREYDESNNVDAALYEGFFSPSDRSTMDIIRQTKPENLPALDIQVSDSRIKPLLFRYRARNYAWTLTEQEQKQWHLHRRDFFEENLPAYMANLEALAELYQDDQKKIGVLKSVYQYVESLVS
ncbi:exodeoxyribonuclease I [Enterovibrio nigricans]|uniref:Exodeoxyribonuclease I n=1 Tax=Enterovibrio nigricans DSM 22720 TaxID=1121868 RepID=A0A1T4UYG8_9GAMM|nr:exodeoxyribonuclease I [Enterovibrio nigricans]SKA57441.1 Exodeoxyribonuclease I subunit C [Enterovibrio nigricans DSM 22720]